MSIPKEWGFNERLTKNVILGFMVICTTIIPILYYDSKSSDKTCAEEISMLQKQINECNEKRVQDINKMNYDMNKKFSYYDSLYRADIQRMQNLLIK